MILRTLGAWALGIAAGCCAHLLGCSSPDEAQPSDAGSDPEILLWVEDGSPVYGPASTGLIGDWDSTEKPVAGGIGTSEQELLSAPTGNRQIGWQPTSETSCMTSTPTQNCVVPPVNGTTERFRFYISGGNFTRIGGTPGAPSSLASDHVRAEINGWYNDMVFQGMQTGTGAGVLQFSEATSISDPNLTYVIQISSSGNVCGGTSARGLSCFTGSTTGISHDSSLVGTYHRMTNVPVLQIDYADIASRVGWTHNNKIYAVRQAVYLGALKGVGQGPTQNSFTTRCDQTDVTSGFICTLSPVHACKVNWYGDYGDPTFIDLAGPDCGS